MNINKLPEALKPIAMKSIKRVFEDLRLISIEFIMSDYNLMLNGVDTNRDSKAKPEYYQDKFLDRLESFKFIGGNGVDNISFTLPDVSTVDLTGLQLLKFILEGVPGKYVTATGKQISDAGLKLAIVQTLDPDMRPQDQVYLLEAGSFERKRVESKLPRGKKLPPYAFSNSPPIDIFETADKYVTENIERLIDTALSDSINHFNNSLRGV